MPIYEFECQKDGCKKREEYLLSFSEEKPKKCEHCKDGDLVQLISRTGFQLNTNGFYLTDYCKKRTQ